MKSERRRTQRTSCRGFMFGFIKTTIQIDFNTILNKVLTQSWMKASHQFDDTIDVYNCAHKTISKPNKIYLPLIETIPCQVEKKHFDWNTNHSDEEKKRNGLTISKLFEIVKYVPWRWSFVLLYLMLYWQCVFLCGMTENKYGGEFQWPP